MDYFGWSYGGTDVTAYATRFGEHLRSIVLDSPSGTPNLDPFVSEQTRTQADPRMVRLDFSRSPTCSSDHPDPIAELGGLIRAVRLQPAQGNAHDANGNLTHVRVDEDALLNVVIAHVTGNFISTGEILAAADSLRRGDSSTPAPTGGRRLPAPFPPSGDSGDPTTFTQLGRNTPRPAWIITRFGIGRPRYRTGSGNTRMRSRDLPADYFAPFSKAAATGQHFSWFGRDCLFWQNPTASSPVAPPHAMYPSVPTLVFSGDLDHTVPLEETRQVAALFPGQHIPASGGGQSRFGHQLAVCGRPRFGVYRDPARRGHPLHSHT